MKPIDLQSIVLIRGDKVCLYGLTSCGTKFLDAYSREEAMVIGEELIEAAIKIQRKRGRAPSLTPSPPHDGACRHCQKPTPRGQFYCSRPCYVADRWGGIEAEQAG